MTRRISICCKRCGGTDVRRDAYAAWNEETQEWELSDLYDNAWCANCGDDIDLAELELPPIVTERTPDAVMDPTASCQPGSMEEGEPIRSAPEFTEDHMFNVSDNGFIDEMRQLSCPYVSETTAGAGKE